MGKRARSVLDVPSARGQLLRALLFVHLLVSPLLFSTNTADAFEFSKAMLLRLIALLLAATGLAAALRIDLRPVITARVRNSLVHRGVALLLCSGFISTLFSLCPSASLRGIPESQAGFLTLLSGTILFLATFELCTGTAVIYRILIAPVLATLAVAGYGLVQVLGLDPLPWQGISTAGTITRCFATLGHANHLAGYLVLTFPILVCLAVRAGQQRRWRYLGPLLTLMVLSCLILTATFSRGAWVAHACALVILAVGYARTGYRWLAWALVIPPFTTAMILAGVAATPGLLPNDVGHRLSNFGSMTSRLHLWRAGLQMFADHPLAGAGMDMFQFAFGRYRTPQYMLVEWDTTPARAHNEVIHLLATQGLLGGIALLVTVGGVVVTTCRAWKRVDLVDRPLVAALAAGLVGFFVHGCLSFTVIGLGTLVITYVAALARLGTSDASTATTRHAAIAASPRLVGGRVVLRAVLGVIVCGLAFRWILAPLAANCCCRAAVERPGDALVYLRRAVELDPSAPLGWVELCAATETAACMNSHRGERRRLLREARVHMEHAVRLGPEDAYQHHNLGILLGRLVPEGIATPGDAFAEVDEALRRDPRNAVFLADAADLASSLGDLDRVRLYAQRGIEMYSAHAPFLAHLGYLALLDQHPSDAATLLEAALGWGWNKPDHWQAATGTCLARAYLALQRYDEALRVADTALTRKNLPEARVARARALEFLGRTAEAQAEYEQVLSVRPDHPAARAALNRSRATAH